jgi:ribonuclease P protein component
MREAYRLQKNQLKDLLEENHKSLAVFFVYTGNEIPQYDLVFEKMNGAVARLEKLL